MLLGGVLSFEHVTSLWITIIVALFGILLGDNAGYIIGRDHGARFLKTVERRFHISKRRIDKELAFFKVHPLKAIFIMRFLPALKVFGPALAGYTRIPWWKYQIVNLVAILIYAPLMVYLGWHFSSNVEFILHDVKMVKRVLTIVVIAIIGFILVKRMLKK